MKLLGNNFVQFVPLKWEIILLVRVKYCNTVLAIKTNACYNQYRTDSRYNQCRNCFYKYSVWELAFRALSESENWSQ